MKILVLGAGTVGTSVAAALAAENNDITVVDTDALRLRELSEKLDLRTVHPSDDAHLAAVVAALSAR